MSIIDIQDSIVLYGIIWLPQKGGLISFERDFYLVSGLIFYDSLENFFRSNLLQFYIDIYKYRYFYFMEFHRFFFFFDIWILTSKNICHNIWGNFKLKGIGKVWYAVTLLLRSSLNTSWIVMRDVGNALCAMVLDDNGSRSNVSKIVPSINEKNDFSRRISCFFFFFFAFILYYSCPLELQLKCKLSVYHCIIT